MNDSLVPVPYFVSTVGLLGLVVGSFLNVVIHRVPAGMSVVRPGSACPVCHAPVRAHDNVPVVSWLLMSVVAIASMAPVSSPTSICIRVMPVWLSPASTAR